MTLNTGRKINGNQQGNFPNIATILINSVKGIFKGTKHTVGLVKKLTHSGKN